MKRKISRGDFFKQFFERESLNTQTLEILESNLILFSPDEESLDYYDLAEAIFCLSNEFDGDLENAGTIFRIYIEKYFLEIQKYLSK